ncbi:uncharacterized protein [Aristolochia californica]|uniref:uncharacterized protein n=1 Tax=Aristolochia californica TaxID=171875 RepID=UPI0035D5DA86
MSRSDSETCTFFHEEGTSAGCYLVVGKAVLISRNVPICEDDPEGRGLRRGEGFIVGDDGHDGDGIGSDGSGGDENRGDGEERMKSNGRTQREVREVANGCRCWGRREEENQASERGRRGDNCNRPRARAKDEPERLQRRERCRRRSSVLEMVRGRESSFRDKVTQQRAIEIAEGRERAKENFFFL